jgi:negative regulator of sigma E activity
MSQLREQIVQAVRLSLALAATIGVVWGVQGLRQGFQEQMNHPDTSITQSATYQR